MNRENYGKIVEGKKPKKLTEEQIQNHQEKMEKFREAIAKRKKNGYKMKYFSEPDELVKAIDEYLDAIKEAGLFPTEKGLMLFLDCSDTWYYAVMQIGDERSEILRKFQIYVSEYLNQSGLSGNSNTIFSIYYLKSQLKQYDQPAEQTFNINLNSAKPSITSDDLLGIVESTPIEVDYTEVEE